MTTILTIDSLFDILSPDLNNLTFVQIGTNNGDDYFNKICKKYKPKNILLVEPHAHLNEQIKQNYQELNYTLENVAITNDENCKSVQMYSATEHTAHSSIKPLKDWNKDKVFATVPAKTLKTLLNQYNFNYINLLYIDTEGFDSFIINYIFNNNLQTQFNSIVYEQWGFSPEHYDEQNELNGQQGMDFIKTRALQSGFSYANFQADGDVHYANHVIYKK
jgi:FkbM family methyltransferase